MIDIWKIHLVSFCHHSVGLEYRLEKVQMYVRIFMVETSRYRKFWTGKQMGLARGNIKVVSKDEVGAGRVIIMDIIKGWLIVCRTDHDGLTTDNCCTNDD